jgi:hypothetical protein
MASLNQIAFRILESVRGNIGADENIDIREIKYDIGMQRAVLVRNELNQNRTINDAIVQSLGCIPVEAVSASACCEGLGECSILRTTIKIPGTVEQHGKDTITRIGGANIMSSSFQYVSYEAAKVSGNGRFNSQVIYAFILEGYVYLVQKAGTAKFKGISKINVMGVFEDPEVASKFSNCDGTSCYSDDDEYPIASWMITYLQDMLIQKYIKSDAVAPSDESLNDKHELKAG